VFSIVTNKRNRVTVQNMLDCYPQTLLKVLIFTIQLFYVLLI